jgi:hypothetical protein
MEVAPTGDIPEGKKYRYPCLAVIHRTADMPSGEKINK